MSTTDLTGKTALVTGANSGIGLVTATELAARGAHVYLASRSVPALERVAAGIGADRAVVLPLDLGDLASVRGAASSFLARAERLDILVNNAGVAGTRGRTASGFELAFGTNHVGHFLLTTLLLDRLRASEPARVVNVSSVAHFQAPGIDWDAVRETTRSFTGMPEYAVSKLANVLFTQELARRLGPDFGVTTYALHPGTVATNVWRRMPWPARPVAKLFMTSAEQGARTTLYCATAPELAGETGHYYDACQRQEPSAVATPALAAELWRRSEEWTQAPLTR